MKPDINELAHYFSQIRFQMIDVVKAIVPPGKKCFGAMTPPFSGLIFPLRGEARMFFNGAPYEMATGKIFYAGPNMTLDKEVLGKNEWEFMVVHFKVEDRSEETLPYTMGHYELEPGHSTRINELLHRLYQVCATPGSLPELRAKSLFLGIIAEILTCATSQRNDKGMELVEQAVDYIKNHYMEQLTVPKLAGRYGLNSKQFAYLFQKHTGLGPNDYIIEHRMSRAKELLGTTACSIAEISACVGYADPYYFSKLFKKRTGFCPSLLRSFFHKNEEVV